MVKTNVWVRSYDAKYVEWNSPKFAIWGIIKVCIKMKNLLNVCFVEGHLLNKVIGIGIKTIRCAKRDYSYISEL